MEDVVGERKNRVPRFSWGMVSSGTRAKYRGFSSANVMGAQFSRFSGRETRSIRMEAGDRVRFRFESRLDTGTLVAELLGPDQSVLGRWGDVPEAQSEINATAAGKYRLQVSAEGASGRYLVELTVL